MLNRLIALDTRLIRHTGIGTYIRTLFPALPNLRAPYEYVAVKNPGGPGVGPWRTLTVRSRPLGVSNQFLPWELRGAHVALLHVPYITIPIAWRGTTVVTIHDLIPLIYPDTIPGVSRRLAYSASARIAARMATMVLTVSENSRRDIIRLLEVSPERIQVVPPAVAPEFAAPVDPQAVSELRARLRVDTYLLAFGRAKPYKNLDRLLRAFSRLSSPRLSLVIVGLSPPPAELLQQAERLRVIDALRLVAYVPHNELPTYYHGAQALVLPSLYEGFGLPALEAMACGTPVVASDRSAIPEVVGDAGVLVDPEDAAGLAEAILRVLDDSRLREELRARGWKQAAAFNQGVLAARLASIYDSLLRREA